MDGTRGKIQSASKVRYFYTSCLHTNCGRLYLSQKCHTHAGLPAFVRSDLELSSQVEEELLPLGVLD